MNLAVVAQAILPRTSELMYSLVSFGILFVIVVAVTLAVLGWRRRGEQLDRIERELRDRSAT